MRRVKKPKTPQQAAEQGYGYEDLVVMFGVSEAFARNIVGLSDCETRTEQDRTAGSSSPPNQARRRLADTRTDPVIR